MGIYLAVMSVACSPNKAVVSTSEPSLASAAEVPAKPRPAKVSPSKPAAKPSADTYEQALSTAMGALAISQSAQSRDDWRLIVSQWRTGIKLLQAVPPSSRNYKNARSKLSQYRVHLAEATLKATPPPSKSCSTDTNPVFFSVPIKERRGGTPIVEVTFNEQKFDMLFDTGATTTLITYSMAAALRVSPVALTKASLADGSVVTLPIAKIKSQGVDGRFRVNVLLAVASPSMEIGLLGQDFYKGYDIAVKDNKIEFRRRGSLKTVKPKNASCLIDTSPKSFRVPIIKREHGVPVVEVTFNNQYKVPMLFDTGSTATILTSDTAQKMGVQSFGIIRASIADGSVTTFGLALIKSQKIAGRILRDTNVGVAPPTLEMGLLGQDFFEGYNYTIKGNVIEFHRQESY